MRFAIPFARWRAALHDGFARFPLVLLSSATGAGSLIYSSYLENDQAALGQCVRLAMTCALGIPLFFSLRLLRERTPSLARIPLEWLGLPLLALWWWAQPARPLAAPEIYFIRWLLLLAALHFFAAVSAYLRFGESLGFWQFNRHLFLRFCLATLYAGVLTVGLELALLSTKELFELKLDHAFLNLFLLMAGCFHPAFFLAGVPRDFAALAADTSYPRGLKAFTQFALAPLVAVYTAILYLYAFKILLARSWPHGWVALPVLLLAGIGIFAALLLHPLRTAAGEKWAPWFARNFPRALAPLSILLLLAVRLRIVDYGFTEQRYLGLVAGCWILAWSLVFIVRQRPGIRWIPLSLGVIACLTAFGPWSAGSVSQASQLRRVVALLQAHGLWVDNHAQPARTFVDLPEKERAQLQSSLRYLFTMHGARTVAPLFATMLDVTKLENYKAADTVLEALNVRAKKSLGSVTLHRQQSDALPLAGYRQLWQFDFRGGIEHAWKPESRGDFSIGFEKGVLKFQSASDSAPQPLPFPMAVDDYHPDNVDLSPPAFTIDFSRGARTYRLIFNEITFSPQAPGGPRIGGCSFLLLEK